MRFALGVMLVIWAIHLEGQVGSIQSFDFLKLSQSARTAALGGLPIALIDDDINLAFINPASANEEASNKLAVNHHFHLAGISYGHGAYSHYIPSIRTSLLAGFQYISYGDFQSADASGTIGDPFNAGENAFVLGAARQLNERIFAGVHIKFISSSFENYDALGIGMDLGLTYHRPESREYISFVVRNLGGQINGYDLRKEDLPLDIMIGFSRRLQYVPFRFFVTAHHLNRWDLVSDFDLNDDPLFFDQPTSKPGSFGTAIDNFFRHFTFGGEIYIGKAEAFRLRAGYDHLRKKDLSVPGFRSFSGLNLGFGLRIAKLNFDYAFGRYHLAGGVNHLSIVVDLNDLFSNL